MDDDDGSLEKECKYCNGSGKVFNFEITKWHLNGFKGEEPNNIFMNCPMCNGFGVMPTNMGLGILDFIGKYNGGSA